MSRSGKRSFRKQRIAKAKTKFKLPVGEWKEVDMSKANHPDWMTRSFINNRYVVMIGDEIKTTKGFAIQALIQKHDDSPIKNHWSELQKIKNQIFGEDKTAIEYYPAVNDLIDDYNIYWLWIFPEGVLPSMIQQ